ncbi:MAG: hypothetical protein DBP02_01970 [gamma proteobacterium symbiont of Ctena orbiculata]|nr:MAG: hypothetical protein DBP02_01970 [gamma proteobacterium symbiont of Ctena orbiculata]
MVTNYAQPTDASEKIELPEWWDDDLHGAGYRALSDEWKTISDIKPLIGKYRDQAFEILRDLVELGLASVEVRRAYRANGSLAGGKAYYRLTQ